MVLTESCESDGVAFTKENFVIVLSHLMWGYQCDGSYSRIAWDKANPLIDRFIDLSSAMRMSRQAVSCHGEKKTG